MHREPRTDAEAIETLALAQKYHDTDLKGSVAYYVYQKFLPRLSSAFNLDRASDREDLESVFFLGIFEATDKAVIGKGDVLYHMSQRGYWRVKSAVNSRNIVRNTVREDLSEVSEARWRNSSTGDIAEVVVERVDADRILARGSLDLTDRAAEAFRCMVTGECGDVTDPGFNKRLAEHMGVSPQRASQYTGRIREAMAEYR